jgi:hypothetical protein
MTIDLDVLAKKILDEKAGLIPPGSVTVEELREALNQQRQKFAAGSSAVTAGATTSRAKRPATELTALRLKPLPGMQQS